MKAASPFASARHASRYAAISSGVRRCSATSYRVVAVLLMSHHPGSRLQGVRYEPAREPLLGCRRGCRATWRRPRSCEPRTCASCSPGATISQAALAAEVRRRPAPPFASCLPVVSVQQPHGGVAHARRTPPGGRGRVVPVRAIEAAGINLIPDAMAHELGQRLRLAVTCEITQTNTVLRCGRRPVKICGRNMANPSNATGRKPSASASTSSPKPRQGTSFVPRPLTPSEIEWLKREGREFQEEYSRIKAEVEKQRTGQSAAAAGVREP